MKQLKSREASKPSRQLNLHQVSQELPLKEFQPEGRQKIYHMEWTITYMHGIDIILQFVRKFESSWGETTRCV